MRKFTILAVVIIMALVNTNIKAQNSDHRWALGVYMNWADFNVVHLPVGDVFTKANWQGKDQMIPSKFSLGRFISPSFNISGAFSTNKLELPKMASLGQPLSTDAFWDADANLEYKFANGYLMKESSWFDPYVYAGFGVSNIDDKTYAKQQTGAGMNFWLLPYLGLNFHGSYDLVFDRENYAHYAAGIKVRFGGGKDTDKDGIADKNDLCPTVFGLKELAGCPDKDNDGIADKDDACPDVAGPKELNGCPDTDGDGILDKDDMCPTEKGLKEFKGCPDRDGDGIMDKDDKCPDVAGLAKFAGCPDRDGDGIPDKDDKCPDVAGIAANNGCPEVKIVEEVKVPEISRIVYFNTGNPRYIVSYKKELDEVVAFMKENAGARLNIDGHADELGSSDLNMKLSDNRSITVINYFKSKGIAADRLIKAAYGETMPAADNKTVEGRSKNRRVEIKTVK